MRIAILSVSDLPTIPPSLYGYGGMPRVSWWLAEELGRLGHEVDLFGAPGTIAPEGCAFQWYPPRLCKSNLLPAPQLEALDKEMAAWFEKHWLFRYDVVHDVTHRMPIACFCEGPILATMQNPNPRDQWGKPRRNLVALSPSHAKMYKEGVPYVYNAVKNETVPYSEDKSGPLLMMGVMQFYKGALPTIEAAKQAEVPLVLAGTQWDSPYGQKCKAAIEGVDYIQYVGEVQGDYKNELLSHARAAMLYVQWPEPGTLFGIEAMCAGTPIIGSQKGCIPDYVIDGETGFICRSVEEMAEAMKRIGEIDPQNVRLRFEDDFTVEIQAQRYLRLYERTVKGETW